MALPERSGNICHSDSPTISVRGRFMSRSASALTYRKRHSLSRRQKAAGIVSRNRPSSAPPCSQEGVGRPPSQPSLLPIAAPPRPTALLEAPLLERPADRTETVDRRRRDCVDLPHPCQGGAVRRWAARSGDDRGQDR